MDQLARQPPLRTTGYLSQLVANWEVDLENQRLAERRLDEEHRLWPVSKVLETYGMPQEISGESGILRFKYESADRERSFTFQFASGLVFGTRFW